MTLEETRKMLSEFRDSVKTENREELYFMCPRSEYLEKLIKEYWKEKGIDIQFY